LLAQPVNDLPSTADALSALGMDSMMVLQALANLSSTLGITLPVRILLNQSTFDGLVEIIVNMLRSTDDRVGGDASSLRTDGSNRLVELVSTGTKRPFFCVPGLLGAGLVFQALSQHWDHGRKLYSFNAPGLEIDTVPCDKVEIIASRYIEVMRQVAPQGPYLIGGYSLGSVVAFEMARMVRRSGERVDACLLIDPPPPNGAMNGPPLFSAAKLLNLALDFVTFEKLSLDEQISVFASWVSETLGLPSDVGESDQQLRLYRAQLHAAMDYAPARYDGPLTLLITRETAAMASQARMFVDDTLRASLGWGALCTESARTCEIPGNHLNAVNEPHAKELARVLRLVLDEADSTGG
jgi:thioesterase domain-containing protein